MVLEYFALIKGQDGTHLGDITLFKDGTATVMNEWEGIQQWFDTHEDAMRYVRGRVCADPIFC